MEKKLDKKYIYKIFNLASIINTDLEKDAAAKKSLFKRILWIHEK